MNERSPLGDRMKQQYENATRMVLPRRTYTLIRVDGRKFSSLLARVEKPFDYRFTKIMDSVTTALCKETGAVFGYVQSDEISVLLTDFASINTDSWFGSVIQKMATIAAGTATAEFCFQLRDAIAAGFSVSARARPVFDGRVFTIPDQVEVANYFVWRQRDCTRNSVSMAAQAYFSPKQLHGKNSGQMQEMLFSEEGINWNDYPAGVKRGRVCERRQVPQDPKSDQAPRTQWYVEDAPIFTAEAGSWLASRIPVPPVLYPVAPPVLHPVEA